MLSGVLVTIAAFNVILIIFNCFDLLTGLFLAECQNIRTKSLCDADVYFSDVV